MEEDGVHEHTDVEGVPDVEGILVPNTGVKDVTVRRRIRTGRRRRTRRRRRRLTRRRRRRRSEAEVQTYRPDVQTCRLADLQTCRRNTCWRRKSARPENARVAKDRRRSGRGVLVYVARARPVDVIRDGVELPQALGDVTGHFAVHGHGVQRGLGAVGVNLQRDLGPHGHDDHLQRAEQSRSNGPWSAHARLGKHEQEFSLTLSLGGPLVVPGVRIPSNLGRGVHAQPGRVRLGKNTRFR
jgi:hypothetical protein